MATSPRDSRGLYFGALLGLVAMYWLIIWLVPVLPCQDLPQHLAYVRIFADYNRPDLRFSELYQLPSGIEPYFVVHLLLAKIASFSSVRFAIRLAMSGYVLATFVALHSLVWAVRRQPASRWSDPQWTTLIGTLCIWSPAVAMGLLTYFLCIPILIFGVAGAIGWMRAPRRFDPALALAAAVILPSLHAVAAGFYLFFLICLAALRPGKRPLGIASAVFVLTFLTFAVWSHFSRLGLGTLELNWTDAASRSLSLDIINELFQITWSNPPLIASQILWTVLGPFRAESEVALALLLLWTLWQVRTAREGAAPAPTIDQTFRRAAVVFCVMSCLVPWGLEVPSNITFINLRMMSTGLPFLIASIEPDWFAPRRAQSALALGALVFVSHFGLRTLQFNNEARGALDLLDKIEPNKIVMPVAFHSRSSAFGKQFRLSHFLPMYYTVYRGGIVTQFWARTIEHLPIGYRPGKELPHPNDWAPTNFNVEHITAVDNVLLERAAQENTPEFRIASGKAEALLRSQTAVMNEIGCEGFWCLYQNAGTR